MKSRQWLRLLVFFLLHHSDSGEVVDFCVKFASGGSFALIGEQGILPWEEQIITARMPSINPDGLHIC